MNFIRNILFKQYNTGKALGAIEGQVFNAMSDVGIVNFIMLAVLSWDSSFGQAIRHYLPFLTNIWKFMLFALIVLLLWTVFRWKFIVPSRVAFNNWQAGKHQNPIIVNQEEIKKMIQELIDAKRKE